MHLRAELGPGDRRCRGFGSMAGAAVLLAPDDTADSRTWLHGVLGHCDRRHDPNAVVLTLDRPFTDPLPAYTGVGYQMYGAFIPCPVGFKRYLNVSDMFDMWSMDIWTSVRTDMLLDPAQQISSNPFAMMPIGVDQRGVGTANVSATYGQQLYQLYPYPAVSIAYQWWAVVDWPALVNNNDELPPQITEEVVTQKALTWAYRDAESRKDIMAAKGSAGNYLALKQVAESDFLTRLKTLRLLDRDAVDSYMVQHESGPGWIQRNSIFQFTHDAVWTVDKVGGSWQNRKIFNPSSTPVLQPGKRKLKE